MGAKRERSTFGRSEALGNYALVELLRGRCHWPVVKDAAHPRIAAAKAHLRARLGQGLWSGLALRRATPSIARPEDPHGGPAASRRNFRSGTL